MDKKALTELPKSVAQDIRRISEMDDVDELRKMLVRTLAMTVENVCRLAAILSRLRALEYDLSELGIGGVTIFLKIADGQILPVLLVRLLHHQRLLAVAANMPLKDQERIANNEPLDVYDLRGPEHRRVIPPMSMSRIERTQVFARDHIRDENEQLAVLRERTSQTKPVVSEDAQEVWTDRKRGCVWFGNRAYTRKDLLQMIQDLEPEKPRRRAKRADG